MTARAALLAAAVMLPAAAGGLEPRFDHRDMHGFVLETLIVHDTLSSSKLGSVSAWRPAMRAGWSLDVLGEGNELIVAVDVALRSLDDPDRERVLVGASARYRSYFGTEELKTFFEAGAYAPLRSRFLVGPLVGLGVIYDFSRRGGVFAAGECATAFGEARLVSLALLTGVHLRFDLP